MILKSPLNYTGSKDKIMTQLLKHFPSKESVSTFYDVFTGGLSVTINTEYDNVISNDIIEPLIGFYQKIYNSSNIDNEISEILSYKIDRTSQEDYMKARSYFNEVDPHPYLFFALVSSCTNNMMRFNQRFKFNQTFGKRSINDNTIEKLRLYYDKMKVKNIKFTNEHFVDLIAESTITKDDFVYLDPPYAGTTGGYNRYWDKDDEDSLHDTLAMLDRHGIRFALSGVSTHKGFDNPNMNLLKRYNIIEIDHNYDMVSRKDVGETCEILVKNF